MDNKNKLRSLLFYIGIPLVLLIMVFTFFNSKNTQTEVYSDIVRYFEKGQVTQYSLNLGSGDMKITLNDGRTVNYAVPSATWLREDIKEHIEKYNNEHPDVRIKEDLVRASQNSWWISILLNVLFIVLSGLALWFLLRKAMPGLGDGGKTMTFGKAKIKNMSDENRKTTFQDVAGADEEKEELEELVEFLKYPQKYNELGARIPKGVLLIGPPGTGKTLLARAVAGEAGVPFFSISGSDFVEMFVGVGASRVRDLFGQAKKNSPCIVFIDEIDAVGRQRGAGLGGGHDEREQTLNQLLVEMDGFGANEGVILIAATNRPDVLDPALLRPGRFDRQVTVLLPDMRGREEILKVHCKGKPLAPNVKLETIAKSTAGFTGADLENLLNEAALLSARKSLKSITMEEVEEATIKVVMGTEKKSHVMTEKEKKLTAYHEAGHALVSYFCKTQDPVHQISIIPRGMAGGYTMSLPNEDKDTHTKKYMEERIAVSLGGRVAEALILEDISTGASGDIKSATKVASSMVKKFGMSQILGPVLYGSDNEEVFIGRDMGHVKNYSEETAAEIDKEIVRIISDGYKVAEDILKKYVAKLHEIAKFLLKEEKMSGEDFASLMRENLELDEETLKVVEDKERIIKERAIVKKIKTLSEDTSKPNSDEVIKNAKNSDIKDK